MNVDLEKIAQKATRETIISVQRWTDSLLTFRTTKPSGYSFIAGTYARLGLADEHGMIWRAFSMTSAPDDDFLEFYGVIVPGGLFTTQLAKIAPGDAIWVEKQTYGFLTVDRFSDGEDLWMLSTGTGIGPYLSMLRDSHVWSKFRNIILVHGVRHATEFAYRDEIAALPPAGVATGTPAKLHVIRATTRDAASGDYLQGRITTLLESGELEKRAGLAIGEAASRIMMCGNPAMIEDMRRLLHQRGLRPMRRTLPGQFVTENYW